MPRENLNYEPFRAGSLISAAILVGALYVGRDIMLPFALAFLLSFLLAPVVEFLERWRIRRIPAVLTVVAIAFTGCGLLSFVLAQQVYELAYELPDYKENILAKARAFKGDGTGVVERLRKSIDEIRDNFSLNPIDSNRERSVLRPTERQQKSLRLSTDVPASLGAEDPGSTERPPLQVEVVESLSAKEIAQGILGPLVSPLASAAMVVVFVIFMLLNREDLRNRFIHLIGGEKLSVATQALDDAASRVSRYLLMQFLINTIYGLVISIGLALIGLPNALLWGTLTAVLRFVPYIGPWIAALMPLAISLAVFDGWTRPGLVLALFVVNELVSNNILEPWLYGASTGISTIGILASAVFWGWIWGPVGLVMATPLTVCLTVVGRHVPQLAFINTLLGDEDVLAPHARFYQRLLAMDIDEAMDVAEDYLNENSLEKLYDDVILPALGLAEQDLHRGALEEDKQHFITQTTREIVQEFGDREAKTVSAEDSRATDAEADRLHAPIFCVPARDEADEIAGIMLAQLLEMRGIHAEVASTKSLSGELMERISNESISIVCISSLPPLAATHARYFSKRLRSKFPHLRLVVGIWQTAELGKKSKDRLESIGIDQLVTRLSVAVAELTRLSTYPLPPTGTG